MTRVLAPAKLTVSLAVTGVRPDGFHELRAEMVTLDLADELTFTEGGAGLVVAAAAGTRAESLGEADNLIGRALAAVGRRAAIHLIKRIPLGGGLGGGSSDAAAVLRWAGCTDPGTAVALGSDVPFSLVGGRALVEGIGDRVTPLPFARRHFVLLLPPFGVDTGRVYAAYDAQARAGITPDGTNALTAAALAVEPRLGRWREVLGQHTGGSPVLAGSGSTWFVEVEPPAAGGAEAAGGGADLPEWVESGSERARLVRAHTVPAGWDGG